LSARLKALQGEEEVTFNVASGSFTAKSVDRRNEKTILPIDWVGAARTSEDRTRFYHGDIRADALASHHKLVSDIGRLHIWEVAVEYDIQQRELAAQNPLHDLSFLDTSALTIIATRPKPSTSSFSSGGTGPGSSSNSRRFNPLGNKDSKSEHKRFRSCCFRCGFSGHLPGDCSNETTTAGHAAVPLAKDQKFKHALRAPGSDGNFFCFSWAKSSQCQYGAACSRYHGCSICGDSGHGAGNCSSSR
jgi:hypothetical protein